jgi:hypothetical protein
MKLVSALSYYSLLQFLFPVATKIETLDKLTLYDIVNGLFHNLYSEYIYVGSPS